MCILKNVADASTLERVCADSQVSKHETLFTEQITCQQVRGKNLQVAWRQDDGLMQSETQSLTKQLV